MLRTSRASGTIRGDGPAGHEAQADDRVAARSSTPPGCRIASSVSALTPIGEAPHPGPQSGWAARSSACASPPGRASPALEVVVCDGTGDADRRVHRPARASAGMDHGRGVLLEGVAHDERGRLVLLNPAYTLLPAH